MGKIINTLRYGKTKTKTFIISVFVLMVIAIVLGIIGIQGMNIILLGISMVLFIVCILMVFKLESATADTGGDGRERSVRTGGSERTGSVATNDRSERTGRSDTGDRSDRGEKTRDDSAGEMPESGDEDRRSAEALLLKTLRGKTRGPKKVRAQMERKLLLEIIKANKRSAVLDRKKFGKRMEKAAKERRKQLREMRARAAEAGEGKVSHPRDAARTTNTETRSREDASRARNTETRSREDASHARSTESRARDPEGSEDIPERKHGAGAKTDYSTYTKNEVRRLRKVYKFPKDACRIIIDSCKSLAIDHAPALYWVKKGRIYLLIFEESARCETLPMNNTKVSYKKNVREEEIIKYNSMREMGVYKEFEDMMPNFSVHGGATGNEYYKNLYIVGKDLVITPRSLRTLMTKFNFEISIFDSLGVKGTYSEYFQKAYEQRVMWTDGVISQNQYQNNIRDILQSMVDDDSIIRYDFMEDLAKMVHHRLITDEYAEYYKSKRL